MNLEWRHLPLIILGGAVGLGLGWLVSMLFPQLDSSVGVARAGVVFGGIAGTGFAVVAIVVRAGRRDPKAGQPGCFKQLNGTGFTLIGRSEQRDDGSYVTTEWFTILWVPVFPVCRYRVTNQGSYPFYRRYILTRYTIHQKLPVRLNNAARIYAITVLIVLGIIGLAFLALR